MNDTKERKFYPAFKRLADILLSLFGLAVLWPVMLVVALLVRRDGGTVLYKQTRIGRDDQPFTLYKFRSMIPNAERLENYLTPEELVEYHKEYKLVRDPRVTKLGNVLRKSSLDELPQLFNILRGDMSLVGPRPLLESELLGNYTAEQRRQLLSVRPGLTGYWQAVSRNESSYITGQRQKQELYYIGRVSLWMDLHILCMTVVRVFSGKGAV